MLCFFSANGNELGVESLRLGPWVKETFTSVTHPLSSLESDFMPESDLSSGVLPVPSLLPH